MDKNSLRNELNIQRKELYVKKGVNFNSDIRVEVYKGQYGRGLEKGMGCKVV